MRPFLGHTELCGLVSSFSPLLHSPDVPRMDETQSTRAGSTGFQLPST